jgi:hypothetical protein
MNNLKKVLSMSAIALVALAVVKDAAFASGGSTAGGGATGIEVGTPLTQTYAADINGQTATWTGNYTIMPSIPGYYSYDTVSISMKGKPINLFDNTPMKITAHFSDSITGAPLETVTGPYFYCIKKVGSTKVTFFLANPPGVSQTRHLDSVDVTDVAGDLLATAAG